MSLSVSQSKGITVITIGSNPNSKWPILCQILGTLCYTPLCSISQHKQSNMMSIYTALAIVQIVVGLLNLITWIVFVTLGVPNAFQNCPFWLGGVFLMIGIWTIYAARYPSYFLLITAVVMNKVSATLAMVGFALYLSDFVDYNIMNHVPTNWIKIQDVLDVTMMIFLALQFCVTLTFSVSTLKEICEKKSVEDAEFYTPLKEELTVSHLC